MPQLARKVTFIITIDQMAKLKFRREESLSLFFKLAPNDPLVYMCPDSAHAVQDIQSVLKRHGVKGKHTNAATQKAVQMALNLVALIQHKEKELIDIPTTDRVNEIMDLYRQAAEKFESAGDPRHSEVMSHMQRFLSQQFTTSILDGTFISETKKDATTSSSTPVGEVLEQPSYNLSNEEDDDDDDADRVSPLKTTTTPEKTGAGQEDPTRALSSSQTGSQPSLPSGKRWPRFMVGWSPQNNLQEANTSPMEPSKRLAGL